MDVGIIGVIQVGKARLEIDMPKSCMWAEADATVVCPAFHICKPTREYEYLDTKIDLKAGRLPDCPLQEVKTCKWTLDKRKWIVESGCGCRREYGFWLNSGDWCSFCGNEIEVGGGE